MKKTPMDEIEEDFWQLFVAFSTGDRQQFKVHFRTRIYNIVNIIRSSDIIVQSDIFDVTSIDELENQETMEEIENDV